MNLKTLLFLLLAFFTTSALSAEMAKIIRMTGTQDVLVTLPDDSEVLGSVGMEMPVGSLIEVRAGTKLFFKTFEGQITVVAAGGIVFLETIEVTAAGKEKTVVELQSGDLVANLDPNKRGTNDYGVRTPKGVAAARGTNYSVSVNGVTILVTVSAGQVTMTIPGFDLPIAMSPGQATTGNSPSALSLSSVLNDPVLGSLARSAMRATAAAVSTLVSDPNSGVTKDTLSQVISTAGEAGKATGDTTLLTEVAATAAAANPDVAADVVTAAVKSDPSSATSLVTAVTNSVTQATADRTTSVTTDGTTTTTTTTTTTPTSGAVLSLSQTLANAANAAALSVGSDETVDAGAVSQTVQSSQAATPPVTTTSTTDSSNTSNSSSPPPSTGQTVEIPLDNTIVTLFSTFTIRLSGGRLIAVTVNDQNAAATVRLVSSVEGVETADIGDGGLKAFTVPAAVTTAVGELNQMQFDNIAAGIRAALPGPDITVPNNTIVVSPSS